VLGATVYFGASKFRVRIDRVENGDSAVAGTEAKKIFSTAEAEAAFKKGHEYLRDKKLEDALKEFEKAAKLSPDSPVAHYWVGMIYFYMKEPEKAIAKFKKVLELEPTNFRSLAMIGKILSFDRAKLDDAIRYLSDSLSLEPEYADARFDLGRIYAMRGDLNRALGEFAVIFRTEPRYALYHYELGRIFEGAKAVDKAKQEYERALQLDPGFSRAKEALDRLN
jgi:protein O-mannosyl-transferase